MEKLFDPGKFSAFFVCLIRGEERENREFVGIFEQAQRTIVIIIADRHQTFGIRIVVVEFLVFRELTVVQPLVQQQFAVGIPQVVDASRLMASAICCISAAFSVSPAALYAARRHWRWPTCWRNRRHGPYAGRNDRVRRTTPRRHRCRSWTTTTSRSACCRCYSGCRCCLARF